ncbi:MAG: hypothetical protein HOL01_23370 [Planctomycetaceae bacterium]|jgi:tetratricopeptide (TPR) repeat protein|nr:hypothetical protein [Planctomycetaceae bacterium]MBT6487614.1 hypothetical protein [Planctomycetaceae bacterium]MBT6497463.1 hypothetical protein [Planctomycetaceae bacterium]
MTDWDDDDWEQDDDEFDRRQRSSGSKTLWIVLGLAGGGVLLMLICGGIFIAAMVDGINNPGQGGVFEDLFVDNTPVEMPSAEVESPEEKHRAVVAAFRAEDVGVDDATLKAIERLFDKLIQGCDDDDYDAISATFDIDRFLLQTKKTGVITDMTVFEESQLRETLSQSMENLSDLQRHIVIHVDPRSTCREFVVYAYLWEEGYAGQEMRWWVIRNGGTWRFFDWEYLDFGMPESKTAAIFHENWDDPGIDEYNRAMTDINEAIDASADGDSKLAQAKLRRAAGRRVFPQVADEVTLRIAYVWEMMDRSHEAIAAARRIGSPDKVPGAYDAQAMAYHDRGHHRKVIEFASKYMEHVGGGPNILELKCDALVSLGRNDETTADLWRWLRFEPDNVQPLQQLAGALDDDNRQKLVEHLSKLDDPVATAVSLAEWLLYSEPDSLDWLVDFVKSRAADSPTLDYLRGLAAQAIDDNAAAAKHFKRAMTREADEDKRNQYIDSFLDVMAEQERYIEAYAAAPDASEAFQNLMGYDDDDEDVLIEDDDDRQRLMEAHRIRMPDDPWIHYHAADLLTKQKKYEEAEREYAACVAVTEDEDLLSSIRYQRISAMIQAGRGKEAYEKIAPSDETFQQVAEHHRRNEETDKLEKLVEQHRALQPNDKQLDLYAGVVAMHRKEYAAADRLFARGYRNIEEDYRRYTYRNQWIENRFKMGRPLTAYGEIKPDVETFPIVARKLAANEDWGNLETLINIHRLQHRRDSAVLTWTAELHWKQKDYKSVVSALAPWQSRVHATDIDRWQSRQLADKLLRSYLRLKRFPEAIRFARQRFEEFGQPERLMIAHAAAGKRADVARFMDEQAAIDRTHWFSSVYSDTDVGPILRGADYLPLRKKYPPGVPPTYSRTQTELLLTAPRQLDASKLQSTLVPVLGENVKVESLPSGEPNQSLTSFLIQADSERFVITFGNDRYTGIEPSDQPTLKDAALTQAVTEHRAWLTLTTFGTDWQNESQIAPAYRLTSALLGDDCSAVYFTAVGRLAANDAELQKLLRDEKPQQALEKVGEQTWLSYSPDVDEEADESMRRRLKEFVSAFEDKKVGEEFAIQVNVDAGFAREAHWISVRRIERARYGGWTFTGEFSTDSRLNPYIRKGEPVAVGKYEVYDWRYKAGGKTFRGRAGK